MTRSAAAKVAILLGLAVLLAGYVVAVVLTKDVWGQRAGTRFTFAVAEGTSEEAAARAVTVVGKRLDGLGYRNSQVRAQDGTLVATVPGADVTVDAVRPAFTTAQLNIRPVIRSVPTQQLLELSHGSPAKVPPDLATAKILRQSTNPLIQVQALMERAANCAGEDPLAGHDDPALPLVTCSSDGKTVYLLAKTIIDGADISRATSYLNKETGNYVVNVAFDDHGTEIWKNFTAANIGTQTAFTLDTRVVSAPEIRESIPGGKTEISGLFTEDSARQLAGTLDGGTLPVQLTFDSAAPEKLAASTLFLVVRGVVVAAGALVTTLVAATVVYLVWSRRQAALVTRYTS